MNKKSYKKDVISLIKAYEILVKGIEEEAVHNINDRAYGGIIRAGKGLLVENITKNLIEIAWKDLGQDINKLSLERKIVKIPIKSEYINQLKNNEVKEYIKNNVEDYYYSLKTDVHVYIDNKFKIAIECKAYTENAMLKRILVDFSLLRNMHPDLICVLLQLESQLGGDYSENKFINYGSESTHTLLSYFNIPLNIITLLEGERKVDKPIHKNEYYKPLKIKNLLKAIELFKTLLSK